MDSGMNGSTGEQAFLLCDSRGRMVCVSAVCPLLHTFLGYPYYSFSDILGAVGWRRRDKKGACGLRVGFSGRIRVLSLPPTCAVRL
jgi:hypothetical protein